MRSQDHFLPAVTKLRSDHEELDPLRQAVEVLARTLNPSWIMHRRNHHAAVSLLDRAHDPMILHRQNFPDTAETMLDEDICVVVRSIYRAVRAVKYLHKPVTAGGPNKNWFLWARLDANDTEPCLTKGQLLPASLRRRPCCRTLLKKYERQDWNVDDMFFIPQPIHHFEPVYYPAGEPGAVKISAKDMERLGPCGLLNDSLIEFGLRLWLNELDTERAKEIHLFNSFFFHKMTAVPLQDSYNEVSSWTSRVDLFNKTYLVIPIHELDHWYLAIIYLPRRTLVCHEQRTDVKMGISHASTAASPQRTAVALEQDDDTEPLDAERTYIFTFDSMGASHGDTIKVLRHYIMQEAKEKKGIVSPIEPLGVKIPVPLQPNPYDCGLYVIHFAQHFVKNPDLYTTFNPATSPSDELNKMWIATEVPYLRNKLKSSLLKLRENCKASQH